MSSTNFGSIPLGHDCSEEKHVGWGIGGRGGAGGA